MGPNSFFRTFFLLIRSLLVTVAGRFFRCLPINLTRCMLVSLLIAWLVWTLLVPHERMGAVGAEMAATALFAFYVAAGLIWALQWTLDEAGDEAIRTLETRSPALLDSVLDSMIDQSGLAEAEIPLEEVRRRWDETTEHLVWSNSDVSRWSLLGSLANQLAKEWLRRRTAIITELMDSLIRNGDTHISAVVVKEYLRDQLVRCVADLARSRMRVMRCCNGVLAATLMGLPVGLCWMANYLSA